MQKNEGLNLHIQIRSTCLMRKQKIDSLLKDKNQKILGLIEKGELSVGSHLPNKGEQINQVHNNRHLTQQQSDKISSKASNLKKQLILFSQQIHKNPFRNAYSQRVFNERAKSLLTKTQKMDYLKQNLRASQKIQRLKKIKAELRAKNQKNAELKLSRMQSLESETHRQNVEKQKRMREEKKNKIEENIKKLQQNRRKREEQIKQKISQTTPLYLKKEIQYKIEELETIIEEKVKKNIKYSGKLESFSHQNIKMHEKLYLERLKKDFDRDHRIKTEIGEQQRKKKSNQEQETFRLFGKKSKQIKELSKKRSRINSFNDKISRIRFRTKTEEKGDMKKEKHKEKNAFKQDYLSKKNLSNEQMDKKYQNYQPVRDSKIEGIRFSEVKKEKITPIRMNPEE